MRGFESILPALDAWDRQTRRDQLEILILCPEGLGPSEAQARSLAANHVIVPTGRAQLHEARALGVEHATGDYLMLAEDHCLPDPVLLQDLLGSLYDRYFRSALFPLEQFLWRRR
nr:glycosyltransferase family 2 protein [Bryobacter sp.]